MDLHLAEAYTNMLREMHCQMATSWSSKGNFLDSSLPQTSVTLQGKTWNDKVHSI